MLIPSTIQTLHVLETHEHIVCTSVDEHHIHIQDLDCKEFHKQLTSFSMNFTSNYDVIPVHFYTTLFIDKPQVIKEFYHFNYHTRGPPNFTV